MAASDASSDTEAYDYMDMERELASMLSAGQDPEELENMAMYHSQVHTYIHTYIPNQPASRSIASRKSDEEKQESPKKRSKGSTEAAIRPCNHAAIQPCSQPGNQACSHAAIQ